MTTSEEDTKSGTGPDPLEPDGFAFHRLARAAGKFRWWRPLLVGGLAAAFYAAPFVLLMVVAVVAGIAFPPVEHAINTIAQGSGSVDFSDPFVFGLATMTLVLMLPALLLATKLVGSKPVGLLSSVVGRLRWRWLAWCGVVASALYAVAYTVSYLIAVAAGEQLTPAFDLPRLVVLLVLTIVLVPLQSAAEEYVFRGYLMQTIGSWLRHPAFAILLPVPLFVIGHDYGPLGMIDVAFFAVVAGWLTWRTGGLEAALALHIVGNATGITLGALGLIDINATDQSLPDLVFSVLVTVTFAFTVLRLTTSMSIQRFRKGTILSTGMDPIPPSEQAER